MDRLNEYLMHFKVAMCALESHLFDKLSKVFSMYRQYFRGSFTILRLLLLPIIYIFRTKDARCKLEQCIHIY